MSDTIIGVKHEGDYQSGIDESSPKPEQSEGQEERQEQQEQDSKGQDAGQEKTGADLHWSVWKLAWPSVLTMVLQTLNSFIDRFFVGHLGSDALAAVGIGGQVLSVLFAVGMSISAGTTALVSRAKGAEENDEARQATNQSLWIAALASVVCVAVLWPLRRIAIGLLHVDPSATDLCIRYLSLTLLGIPALFVMLILSAVLRGLNDTVTPLRVMIGVDLIHIGGDYLLIFGHFGLPRLGLTGGAIALVVSQVVGAALYFWFVQKTRVRGFVTCLKRPELGWAKRILGVGGPAAAQNVSQVLSAMVFTGVLAHSPEGTAAVTALTIGQTSEGIATMPGFGFAAAAETLSGQNLGAENPNQAERSGWASWQQGAALMVLMGVVFFVFARPFAHIFTHDPHVVPLTVAYLRITALSEPFLALGLILSGALNGAGDTKAPAWAGITTLWGFRLPLAWLLIFHLHLGATGAWWAMTTTTVLDGVIVLWLFKQGGWKKTKV